VTNFTVSNHPTEARDMIAALENAAELTLEQRSDFYRNSGMNKSQVKKAAQIVRHSRPTFMTVTNENGFTEFYAASGTSVIFSGIIGPRGGIQQ